MFRFLQQHTIANMSTISRITVSTPAAAKPVAPYNQAVIADRTVYLSGCLGLDKDTKQLVEGGAGPEMRVALQNMTATLKAAGSSVANVVKATVFLADLADFATVNTEYAKVFTENFPARSCFQVAKLPLNGRVEIEVIAIVGDVKHKSINLD